jgi:hypothetical protein
MLLENLFGVDTEFIERYVSGLEKYVRIKDKDRILRGFADNLFGNVIIEFEARIPESLNQAKEQLQRYAAGAWSQEGPGARRPYLCIATDGVRFHTLSPILAGCR